MKKYIIFLILLLPSSIFANGGIDINSAPLESLQELSGIGPIYAQRIIDGRPFSTIDDLLKIKGIGEKTLEKIKDQGLAFVENQKEDTPKNILEIDTTPTKEYPLGVLINEILPNPEGADDTQEFIELYNTTQNPINISDWKLKDSLGTITTYTFPENTIISAYNFLIVKRPETKILLNNDGDIISFLTPDDNIVDTVTYPKASLGKSYSKSNTNWIWTNTATPAIKNSIQTSVEIQPTKTLPNKKDSVTNNGVDIGLASISDSIPNQEASSKNNPWFLFYIVLGIIIISTGAILYIKFIILKNHVRT